ncbi:hypothetical protein HYV12_02375 [Candidatus Dojkabacteria bacterium]|nr:hypothetical protein [Candidatus Dojkabacteria bacterium]
MKKLLVISILVNILLIPVLLSLVYFRFIYIDSDEFSLLTFPKSANTVCKEIIKRADQNDSILNDLQYAWCQKRSENTTSLQSFYPIKVCTWNELKTKASKAALPELLNTEVSNISSKLSNSYWLTMTDAGKGGEIVCQTDITDRYLSTLQTVSEDIDEGTLYSFGGFNGYKVSNFKFIDDITLGSESKLVVVDIETLTTKEIFSTKLHSEVDLLGKFIDSDSTGEQLLFSVHFLGVPCGDESCADTLSSVFKDVCKEDKLGIWAYNYSENKLTRLYKSECPKL